MPLWKQRMFSRLCRPADDEGGDLGGGSAMDALDRLADDAGAPEAEAEPEAAEADEPAEASKLDEMLEALTGDKPEPEAEQAPEAPKAEEAKAEEKPAIDDEEAEALKGVKSERGRERIQRVFAERKQLEAKSQQLEQDINEFRTLVTSTGMSAGEFAQTLQFGKLAKSENPQDVESAIQILEAQRAALYQRIGKEAPGVDLLAGHQDLRASVENMEISREKAVELASLRAHQAKQRAAIQEQQQSTAAIEQAKHQFDQARVQMESYINSRAKEVDHPARVRALTDYFAKPGVLQQFVEANQTPAQLVNAMRWMYDNVPAARQEVPRQQPISSRVSTLGKPSTAAMNQEDRIMSLLDNL